MFVDASALTAIIAGEPDAAELAGKLQASGRSVTSPLAVWETTVALSRISGRSPGEVRADVMAYLALAGIRMIAIRPEALDAAVDAFERFGKGRHPAALNFGDCFAYACARQLRLPLLFKGQDFGLTDVETV